VAEHRRARWSTTSGVADSSGIAQATIPRARDRRFERAFAREPRPNTLGSMTKHSCRMFADRCRFVTSSTFPWDIGYSSSPRSAKARWRSQ
jgi:hypothetical protein